MLGSSSLHCPYSGTLSLLLSALFLLPSSCMRKGTKVSWKYGTGTATGKIEEVFKESVTRKLKGHAITRHGTVENPAFLIQQPNGDRVLKLKSEVQAVVDKKESLTRNG